MASPPLSREHILMPNCKPSDVARAPERQQKDTLIPTLQKQHQRLMNWSNPVERKNPAFNANALKSGNQAFGLSSRYQQAMWKVAGHTSANMEKFYKFTGSSIFPKTTKPVHTYLSGIKQAYEQFCADCGYPPENVQLEEAAPVTSPARRPSSKKKTTSSRPKTNVMPAGDYLMPAGDGDHLMLPPSPHPWIRGAPMNNDEFLSSRKMQKHIQTEAVRMKQEDAETTSTIGDEEATPNDWEDYPAGFSLTQAFGSDITYALHFDETKHVESKDWAVEREICYQGLLADYDRDMWNSLKGKMLDHLAADLRALADRAEAKAKDVRAESQRKYAELKALERKRKREKELGLIDDGTDTASYEKATAIRPEISDVTPDGQPTRRAEYIRWWREVFREEIALNDKGQVVVLGPAREEDCETTVEGRVKKMKKVKRERNVSV